MFSHITIGTNDLAKARTFYNSVLGALGYENIGDRKTASLWGSPSSRFVVLIPADRNAAQAGNGLTVGFKATDQCAVDEFNRRALQKGGTDAGAPGPRDAVPNLYAAYVRDSDGHKIVASCVCAKQ